MVLFVLHKLSLQTCMLRHPEGLDVWCLVGSFVYFHTPCVRTGKALARLPGCAGSPEPSLVTYVIKYHNLMSWLIFICIILYKDPCIYCKQCRPWSDTSFCYDWSGSTLSVKVPLFLFMQSNITSLCGSATDSQPIKTFCSSIHVNTM